jgi:uncharacterized protein (TIGR03000 family)
MSPYRFLASIVLALTIILSAIDLPAYGHGGGHGGGGHGGGGHGGFGHGGFGPGGFGHGGFGYGGFHGFGYGGFNGFGYGFRGFGFGGFGSPFFGGFGYPGFGFGGLGYGLFGFGGLGYGGLGYGGLGYGGLGLGGLGYGGFGFRGFGYGYGGFSGACNCGYLSAYPAYGGGIYSLYGGGSVPVPVYGGGSVPALGGGDPLPMPRGVSARPRYVDYYARSAGSASPSATASAGSPTRYADYYAHNAAPVAEKKALLHVSLPADAELWLNGKRMTRTGTEREFITPKLQEGETYAYQIKARWTQDGRPQEETIDVKVRANKTTNVRLGESSLAKR